MRGQGKHTQIPRRSGNFFLLNWALEICPRTYWLTLHDWLGLHCVIFACGVISRHFQRDCKKRLLSQWGKKSSMRADRHGCLLSRSLWWPDIWGPSLSLQAEQAVLLHVSATSLPYPLTRQTMFQLLVWLFWPSFELSQNLKMKRTKCHRVKTQYFVSDCPKC